MAASFALPTIAAFDFDHTLIDRDSLLPLLIYKEGWLRTSGKLLGLLPDFIGFLCGIIPRQSVKEKILQKFFKGMSVEEMQKIGKSYADCCLDPYLRPEALQRLKWHQAQGHHCLLVSASLEIYLKPWAERHGFQDVIASRLELTSKGLLTGRLIGLNCWGAEKKRRLLERFGPKQKYQLYMYGDSQGDQDLLELADYPFYRKFH